MRFPLLRCLAKAVVKHGVKFLCNLAPGGGVVYDIAVDVVEDYRRDSREDALRAELQALAQASAEQVHQQVEADVQAEAANQPPEVRQALTAYLTQVPAAIRRSLRRVSDPSGTTIPATLSLSRPEELMAFLPSRPPRFRLGDRPLPGVDWELEELVGVGGFGEVWKARHVHLRSKAPVALKFCLDSTAAPSLRNEAGVLDRVMRHGRHPGIVRLLNTYLSADPPCLEYEFVEGGDLSGLIQDLHRQGRMTPDTANRLFRHLVEIVAHAHRATPSIVHGDLKPANVLVRRGSDGKIGLRVTDFGIGGLAASQAACESRQPTRSRQELLTEAVRGAYTPLYASPEQMTRRKGELADPRDDVHALGVIWYQLLTGDLGMMSVPPDWREQVEEGGLNAELIKLLASCIASRAAKRTASAVAIIEQFQAVLSSTSPPPSPSSPPPQKARQIGHPDAEPGPGNDDSDDDPACRARPIFNPDVERELSKKRIVLRPKKIGLNRLQANPPVVRRPSSSSLPQPHPKEHLPSSQKVQPGELVAISLSDSITMRFAWIPPGTFLMGSPPSEAERSDDETQHRVTLTRGFHLGIHPVTQAQWQAVMGDNPSHFKGHDRPVEQVSWDDCQAFCTKLGQLAGKRFRLPTEAEWEYACRAGTTTAFHFGNTIRTDQANYDGKCIYGQEKVGIYRQQTMQVGSFPANAWGLYDMHGNVWEWCADQYRMYMESDLIDPQYGRSGATRVLRGGTWNNNPSKCRSATRYKSGPTSRFRNVGCRIALCLD